MTWNTSDLLANTGASMPDSYYEQGREDYEQLVRDVVATEDHWSNLLERGVYVFITEYAGLDHYTLHLTLEGFAPMTFRSIFELETYLERMFPGDVTA